MQGNEIRKEFGKRIKLFRQQHHLTQKEMAAKLEVALSQYNKYEYGLHFPPIEKLVLLANLFDTTIDYLITGSRTDDSVLNNTRFLKRFKELEGFDAEDQEAMIKIIDAMIMKNKVQGAMSLDEKAG